MNTTSNCLGHENDKLNYYILWGRAELKYYSIKYHVRLDVTVTPHLIILTENDSLLLLTGKASPKHGDGRQSCYFYLILNLTT